MGKTRIYSRKNAVGSLALMLKKPTPKRSIIEGCPKLTASLRKPV
jgi:hypothetical protein